MGAIVVAGTKDIVEFIMEVGELVVEAEGWVVGMRDEFDVGIGVSASGLVGLLVVSL